MGKEFCTKWDPVNSKWLDPPVIDFTGDPGRTVQASRDEVDINKIVARVLKGATVPVVSGEPFYGDVSEFGGLQDALIKVQEANDLFMQYPADLRNKFDNDPVKFVDFMENPDNLDEAISLGLAVKKPVPEQASPAAPSAAAKPV